MDRNPTPTLEDKMFGANQPAGKNATYRESRGKLGTAKTSDEIMRDTPTEAWQSGEFSKRRVLAGSWRSTQVKPVVNAEIWIESTDGEWRQIHTTKFYVNGSGQIRIEANTGRVVLILKHSENGPESELCLSELSQFLAVF
jgi:hypothetical protein